MRREVRLETNFAAEAFEAAFDRFAQIYNVPPALARCSPDVLARYCRLFEAGDDAARRREVRFRGVPLFAAVLPVGTIAFEGEVDEERMGDW
ncbi:MAG TPA: hypothetical protein VNF68_10305 [Candidatus Baltobacteraceae bacterium]|nr:hypothetical protein [Candidatus Baltobacteraceae bacterium]